MWDPGSVGRDLGSLGWDQGLGSLWWDRVGIYFWYHTHNLRAKYEQQAVFKALLHFSILLSDVWDNLIEKYVLSTGDSRRLSEEKIRVLSLAYGYSAYHSSEGLVNLVTWIRRNFFVGRFNWAWWDKIRALFLVVVVEKAEDFKNAGNNAYTKNDFAKAIFFYTEVN